MRERKHNESHSRTGEVERHLFHQLCTCCERYEEIEIETLRNRKSQKEIKKNREPFFFDSS